MFPFSLPAGRTRRNNALLPALLLALLGCFPAALALGTIKKPMPAVAESLP